MHPFFNDEFNGPFPSWVRVNTAADGFFDTTAAIQKALESVGNSDDKPTVVYLPAGTYRITDTLLMQGVQSVAFVGESPLSTHIIWDGPQYATMFWLNGVAYSRFSRITFDGANLAATCVSQAWDGSYEDGKSYDGGNEYTDCRFLNAQSGIAGGYFGNGFAETTIARCHFSNMEAAGVSLWDWNALDIWVWYCTFDKCNVGVTNTFGAGNYKVYNCLFKETKEADCRIGNTGEFAMRSNTSISSNAFLLADYSGNPCNITVAGNTILDPIQEYPINIENQGGVVIIGNTIRSRQGAFAGIRHIAPTDSSNAILANTFTKHAKLTTAKQGLQVDNDNSFQYGNIVVERSTLESLTAPVMPDFLPKVERKVFEVPKGANAAKIQSLINQATKAGNKSIVHFAQGGYEIEKTLTIPVNSDVQLIGDTDGSQYCTFLKWAGGKTAPVIKINGASKATLKYFSVDNRQFGAGIQITGVDVAGARLYMQQPQLHGNNYNLYVAGQKSLQIIAENGGYSNANIASTFVKDSKVLIHSGSASDSKVSYRTRGNAQIVVKDVWYESNSEGFFADIQGNGLFVLDACKVHSPGYVYDGVQTDIKNMKGTVIIAASNINGRAIIEGTSGNAKVLFAANDSALYPQLKATKDAGIYVLENPINNKNAYSFGGRVTVDGSIASEVYPEGAKITDAILADLQKGLTAMDGLVNSNPTASDIRIMRVWSTDGKFGIKIY